MTILDTIRAFFSGSDQEKTAVRHDGRSCAEGYTKHFYGRGEARGPICLHCLARNRKYVPPPLPNLLAEAREMVVTRGPFIATRSSGTAATPRTNYSETDAVLGELPNITREQVSR